VKIPPRGGILSLQETEIKDSKQKNPATAAGSGDCRWDHFADVNKMVNFPDTGRLNRKTDGGVPHFENPTCKR